jgi:hypothetical protein
MKKLNQKGSILIFATLSFALLGTFVGLAIDFGNAYLWKNRLTKLVDGAALAAAKALKGQVGYEDEATRAACDSMVMNNSPVIMTGTGSCASTDPNFTVEVSFFDAPVPGGPPIRHVEVIGTLPVRTTFLRFLGLVTPGDFTSIDVGARAHAGPERPVDLMLVLDRSGSMTATDGSGQTKINALKIAVDTFLSLSNTFSADDRLGMISFATRGCGNPSGGDSTATTCTPDVPLDFATSSHLSALRGKVNGLDANGGTNTMEALRTARPPLAQAFDDADRATTRKAVLLVTDGQPTFLRRETTTQCRQNPIDDSLILPAGPNGCVMGVPSNPGPDNRVMRRALTSSGSFEVFSTPPDPPGQNYYLDFIRCTRSLVGCRTTNGAMYEANLLRNCGYLNSSCGAGGNHDLTMFAIAIGKPEPSNPQSSLDRNAKCLLARIANAPDVQHAATGVVQKLVDLCASPMDTTIDGDTHADLVEGWPCGSGPCINGTQQKGKVYIIDVNGNVTAQLQQVFNEIAALLKLRLVL